MPSRKYLRDTPRFDRSHWPQEWTEEWRYQVADYFCGKGGVGRALQKWLPHRMYFGVDKEPYGDEYPGSFVQADLISPFTESGPSHLPFGGSAIADVAWVSWPCTAYSPLSATHYGSKEAALEANHRIPDAFREWLLERHAHYVIENVPRSTAVGDLDANCRVNGLAFGKPFDLTRHFETTFEVPDAYVAGDPDVAVDTRDDQSIGELADAKDVPAEWGKQAVRSAIPWQYVWWILGHCPSIEIPVPKTEQRSMAEWGDGVGAYLQFPDDRLGGTDAEPADAIGDGTRGVDL